MAAAAAASAAPWGVSTGVMVLLFGTNALLYGFFQLLLRLPTGRFSYEVHLQDTDEDEDEGTRAGKKGAGVLQKQQPAGGKKMSEPFRGTLECFTNLTQELFSVGCILALTYVCEKHWYTDHLGKTYDRDLFVFVLLVFFGYAYLTTKKTEDVSLLSPDQTLEWKGWMQFIFLLYHYFHAEEVYNSVRVMITCYVWMTGYGQFSSYYTKQDFGWLKVSHNLWRLNFAVLLLMWTHGNTYILYYICPMHTFYFLMVYVTMYIYSSVNHSKWGIRLKLLALGLVIFVVWDVNGGLFDLLFAWLGTDSVVGANNGSVWEYYFRTSLDHWSSYLGMIFALNYPMADQFFNKVRGGPLIGTSILMAVLAVWWYMVFYTQEKMAYNLTHSYFAIIPLTVYIFFRNITPSVRRYVSYSLVDLGKTTLETYLLQHHIWLTSNAKTLLNITPGYPWVNFFLASLLFLVCSKELYRITTSLRAMFLPEEKFPEAKTIAINNMLGICAVLAVCAAVAAALAALEASVAVSALSCVGLFLACLLLISRFAKPVANNATYQLWLPKAMQAAALLLAAGMLVLLVSSSMASPPPAPLAFLQRHHTCLDHISHGKWVAAKCPDLSALPGRETKAFCETDSWVWEPLSAAEAALETAANTPACPVGKVSPSLAKTAFKYKRIVIIGDSVLRNTYHALNGLLDPQYRFNASQSFRHGNLAQRVKASNTTVEFYWAPFVANVTTTLGALNGNYDLLVCGAAAWDALYTRSGPEYARQLEALAGRLKQLPGGGSGSGSGSGGHSVTVWLQPTTVVDNRLTTAEKQQFMSERVVASYRSLFLSSPARTAFGVTIDPTAASRSREGSTVDGVHYSEDIYRVIAQLCANAYTLHFPQLYVGPKSPPRKIGKPKATGPMSFPSYGLVVLAVAAVMLYTMDAFFGLGWATSKLLGLSDQQAHDMSWDVAYGIVHRAFKIAHPGGGGGGVGGGGGGGGGGGSSANVGGSGGSRGSSERGDSDREEMTPDSAGLLDAPSSARQP